MELLATLNYPYQFLIRSSVTVGRNGSQYHTINEIQDWCKENCKGLYVTASETYVRIYAPVQQVSPITGQPFEPSSISSEKCILLAFAEEDEAAAFKLTFENAIDVKK